MQATQTLQNIDANLQRAITAVPKAEAPQDMTNLLSWAMSNGYRPLQHLTFLEPQNGYEMNLSMGDAFKFRAGSNLLIVALGVALSGLVAGWVQNLLPFGTGGIPKIIIGFVLSKWVLKGGAGNDFAKGIMLGGIAELASGLAGGLGGIFGEPWINDARNRGSTRSGPAAFMQGNGGGGVGSKFTGYSSVGSLAFY